MKTFSQITCPNCRKALDVGFDPDHPNYEGVRGNYGLRGWECWNCGVGYTDLFAVVFKPRFLVVPMMEILLVDKKLGLEKILWQNLVCGRGPKRLTLESKKDGPPITFEQMRTMQAAWQRLGDSVKDAVGQAVTKLEDKFKPMVGGRLLAHQVVLKGRAFDFPFDDSAYIPPPLLPNASLGKVDENGWHAPYAEPLPKMATLEEAMDGLTGFKSQVDASVDKLFQTPFPKVAPPLKGRVKISVSGSLGKGDLCNLAILAEAFNVNPYKASQAAAAAVLSLSHNMTPTDFRDTVFHAGGPFGEEE